MSILTDHTAEAGTTDAGFDMLASREYVAPRANLLPPEIADRLALRRLTAAMIAGVVACGGIVGALYVNAESGRAPAKAALAQAHTQNDGLVAQENTLAPSQVAHQKVLAAKSALQAATGSEVLWSDQLNTLRSHLVDGVRLSSLTVTEAAGGAAGTASAVTLPSGPANQPTTTAAGTAVKPASAIASVTLNGVAVSNYAVADWLDKLSGLAGWTGVYLSTVSQDATHGTVTYAITASITSEALSHRYTTGN